ncbi:hypothetical protein WA158_006410 [Blastocystis sp. Blastoise]
MSYFDSQYNRYAMNDQNSDAERNSFEKPVKGSDKNGLSDDDFQMDIDDDKEDSENKMTSDGNSVNIDFNSVNAGRDSVFDDMDKDNFPKKHSAYHNISEKKRVAKMNQQIKDLYELLDNSGIIIGKNKINILTETVHFIKQLKGQIANLSTLVKDAEKRAKNRLDEVNESVHSVNINYHVLFLQNSIPQAILSTDGQFINANLQFKQLLDIQLEKLKDLSLFRFAHPDDLPCAFGSWSYMLNLPYDAEQKCVYQSILRHCYIKGTIKPVLFSLSLLRNEKGRPTHFLCTVLPVLNCDCTSANQLRCNGYLHTPEKEYVEIIKLPGDIPDCRQLNTSLLMTPAMASNSAAVSSNSSVSSAANTPSNTHGPVTTPSLIPAAVSNVTSIPPSSTSIASTTINTNMNTNRAMTPTLMNNTAKSVAGSLSDRSPLTTSNSNTSNASNTMNTSNAQQNVTLNNTMNNDNNSNNNNNNNNSQPNMMNNTISEPIMDSKYLNHMNSSSSLGAAIQPSFFRQDSSMSVLGMNSYQDPYVNPSYHNYNYPSPSMNSLPSNSSYIYRSTPSPAPLNYTLSSMNPIHTDTPLTPSLSVSTPHPYSMETAVPRYGFPSFSSFSGYPANSQGVNKENSINMNPSINMNLPPHFTPNPYIYYEKKSQFFQDPLL